MAKLKIKKQKKEKDTCCLSIHNSIESRLERLRIEKEKESNNSQ